MILKIRTASLCGLILIGLAACQPKEKTSEETETSGCADHYELPLYFDSARVQAHTRMGLRWLGRDSSLFYSVAENFDELGVKVFTRHIKGGSEGAWWPSKLGAIEPAAKDNNIAKILIDNAHRNGQKIVVYHRHLEDAFFAEQHPDWMNRTPDGKEMRKRGLRLCLNSPYADAFLERALELIDLGADAFYFDEQHIPKVGCWCDYCRNGFEKETGLEMPGKIDLSDPVYLKLLQYKNSCIERVFRRYREEFHKLDPNLVMLIGSNNWPSMAGVHTSNKLYRIADIQKTEFHLPVLATGYPVHPYMFPDEMKPFIDEVKMAHGWVLARDATGGRPAHVWVNGLLNEASALSATSGLVGHGCIANLDQDEGNIPNRLFKSSFSLGNGVSPYLAGTKPFRWVALHHSEQAREQYWGDSYGAWENVIYPHYGAYQALVQERLPVGMITDSQLEDNLLEGYKILFITDRQYLTDYMKEAIMDFEGRGGHVIYNDPAWKWHEDDGQKLAINSFLSKIAETKELEPGRVIGGPDHMQVDYFISKTKKRISIACINDFSWVWTGKAQELKREKPLKYQEIMKRKPPEPCVGVTIALQGELGRKPSRVFDAASGDTLEYKIENQGLRIKVPKFDFLTLVVVEY